MAINWETVLVAITTGVGAAAISNVIGPVTTYFVDKKNTRNGWRRAALNSVRDYVPRFLQTPEHYDPLINTDGFTRLRPYLSPQVVALVESEAHIDHENGLVRPRWAQALLNDLDRLERKWSL